MTSGTLLMSSESAQRDNSIRDEWVVCHSVEALMERLGAGGLP
jgi:hypothetical protein